MAPGRATPQLAVLQGQKKIRAPHAKEKQQITLTCRNPNRL